MSKCDHLEKDALIRLLRHRDFDYAAQATARNNRQREALIFARLEAIAAFNERLKYSRLPVRGSVSMGGG